MVVLYKRHKVSVIINLRYKYFLSFILLLVGMFQHIQQETFFDVKNDVFKRDLSFRIYCSILCASWQQKGS